MRTVIENRTVGETVDADAAFSLHHACFGDTREWFDTLLAAAAGQQYLAAMRGGRLCGGLFLFDADLFVGEKAYAGKYVYALGVLPAFRGQGIARALLAKAKALSPTFTLICAANAHLAATYAKYGFDRFVGGTVPVGAERGAEIDTSAYKAPCTYADATRCGGVFLSEKLFAFSLDACGSALYTNGSSVIARSRGGVYAAYGLPAVLDRKAQICLKTEIDTSKITADLILEV